MIYKGRAISDDLLDLFKTNVKDPSKNGQLSVITEIVRQDPYLDLEMRGDCVILYYRGGKLLTIRGVNEYKTLAEEYYLSRDEVRLSFDIENPLEYISKAKFLIDKHETAQIERGDNKKSAISKLGEKEIQQRVVYENNMSVNATETEYFIADVEWADNSVLGGRADIVAFRWERMNHGKRSLKLVMIEVKQGDGAISGKNGLQKHYEDFLKFKDNKESFTNVSSDMLSVLKQKYQLKLVKGLDKLFMRGEKYVQPTIEQEPEFLFLLSNYHHFSTKLKSECDKLPDETRFIISSFMGYGLYDDFIYTKKQLKEMFPFVFNKNKVEHMTYKTKQQKQQEIFRKSVTNKGFTYILDDSERDRNLYNWQDKDSVQKVKDYFKDHDIKWWSCKFGAPEGENITCNLLSSQIACINHLFFIRHDKDAVLSIINGIKGMPAKFKKVLNIPCDNGSENYISFEVIASKDYLHEKYLKRGEYCTSIDALIYALDENNERWLIPIEWKYTETYERDDLSIESDPDKEPSNESRGKTRLSRYCNIEGDNLIGNSKQLKSLPDYKHSIYFQEPFYQLMRQTLWAECICENKEEKVLPAEHFVHIHVCPKGNKELLNKCYSEVTDKQSMEEAWREMLLDQSLYHLVDPKELLQPITKSYPELYNYLQDRYWK